MRTIPSGRFVVPLLDATLGMNVAVGVSIVDSRSLAIIQEDCLNEITHSIPRTEVYYLLPSRS